MIGGVDSQLAIYSIATVRSLIEIPLQLKTPLFDTIKAVNFLTPFILPKSKIWEIKLQPKYFELPT